MPTELVHYEIPADDSARARAFWGSLFGWEFEPAPGAGDYQMARTGERTGAAVSGMEPGKRGARAYFSVDDMDAGLARVRELGGRADEKQAVPGMGWFATCRDTEGNEFGLWQTDPSAPAPATA